MEKNFRRLLSFVVVMVMVLGMVPAGAFAAEEAPALPTATVTELNAEELGLTFAMNFTADPATEEQLEYYGTWPADYILTSNKDIVFNNDGSGDGWLGGQYTAFNENWITVPMGESVTLPANTPVRVMETAMALMGYTTALTYADIYDIVKSFNCGLFLDEEFLAANPDLEITLDLRVYNPENSSESYAIGSTYEFGTAPELPTASVTMLDAESLGLTFAMNFTADPATEEQLEYYGTWPADYILTSNKDIVFNNDGSGDGWLGGQYTAFNENWITVPMGESVTLPANTPVRVMETAMALMGYTTALTYADIYDIVKSFNCGLFLDEEFLAANPDLEITLDLRVYNPENPNKSYAIGPTYEFNTTPEITEAPELPTATVKTIENDRLTFAMNFKADKATAEQLAYYGNWYADFVLSVNKNVSFNADGGADGFLSGQYDAWSENWVDVPYGKGNVNLAAGESLKIMEFASKLMGKPGLKYTYKDVYEKVKNFDCGVFFTEEFLEANPDLEVTLELRAYNPADESENYKIGNTYVFTLNTPELPTATATEIENDRLTFAMNFKADPATDAQLTYYGSWYADYVLTINKNVSFNADGGADGFLSGQYDAWSENWVDVPYGKGNVTLAAGEELQIMKFAAELMGKKGLRYTYQEVYDRVKDFDCGVFFEQAFLDANPDLEVTLELRVYNPANEAENYKIGDTYVFTLSDVVAEIVETGEQFATVAAALDASVEGQTVRLLKNVTGEKAESLILILNDRTLDLAGYTLEATNVVAVTGGAKIEDSTDGEGLLQVAKDNMTLPSNDQLPIWCADDAGYRFTTVEMDNWEYAKNAESLSLMYWFIGSLDADMKQHLAKISENELKIVLRVSYMTSDGSEASLDIVIPEDVVLEYANTEVEPYFLTTISGLNKLGEATITTCVISGYVEVPGVAYTYTAVTE